MKRILSRLTFITTVPIIVIWLTAGVFLYSYVKSGVSEFYSSIVQDDMMWLSRETLNVCNAAFDRVIKSGRVEDQAYIKITKNRTLLDIEDTLRNLKVDAIVADSDKKAVFTTEPPYSIEDVLNNTPPDNTVSTLKLNNSSYYCYSFRFDPWDWHVILLRPVGVYAVFLERLDNVYTAAAVAVCLTVLATSILIYLTVNYPLNSISRSVSSGKKPEYIGVGEFESLGRSISSMMESVEQLNSGMELSVANRTRELQIARTRAEKANRIKSALLEELEGAYSALKSAKARVLELDDPVALERIVAGIAHEINNPAGFIAGRMGMLQKYSRRVDDYLKIMADAIEIKAMVAREGHGGLFDELVRQKQFDRLDFIINDIETMMREALDEAEKLNKMLQNLKSLATTNWPDR